MYYNTQYKINQSLIQLLFFVDQRKTKKEEKKKNSGKWGALPRVAFSTKQPCEERKENKI